MATSGRQSSLALNRVVSEQYGRFNVFQLVRLLRHRQGGSWPIAQRLHFRADLRASFPGQEVTRLRQTKAMPDFRNEVRLEQKMPARIEVRTPNFCLASELGALPDPFLEWVRDQERVGGRAMAAFLDVFNQRVHVLRHELKLRSLRALDPSPPADTDYAGQLAALMGVALPAQQQQMPLPMRAWLGLAGLLVNCRKSAIVVSQVLSAYLSVTANLQMLVGSWRDIEESDKLALGRKNHALGRQSLLGRRTWDARAAVQLNVAQMSFEACNALLPLRPARKDDTPSASAHNGLVAMIRLLLDQRFDCEVNIALDPASIPPPRLNLPWRSGGLGLRLGQTAWLGRRAAQSVRFRVSAFDNGAPA
ncbi:MAG TPA: type VI secretion system baseplate subunit TssG [Rhodocyclaceae bacterium]|nr:type VI secretion system baseplate subunit TssG [Rhodocyclaceae bacterium]